MDGASRHAAIARLEKFPRLPFGRFPTPIEEMPRLRATLGPDCPRLFIKRDDYSGFGFGGNKIRKLAYVFAQLQESGVKAIATTGGERSNHARMTAFVCARLGWRCVLVLDRKPRPVGTNDLKPAAVYLEQLLGAEVHIVDSIVERNAKAAELVAEIKQQGVKVFEIPLGGALAHGTLGFVTAMSEISAQMKILGVELDHIFFASSTAGTHAGMLVGKKLFDLDNLRIVGIAPEPNAGEISGEVKRLLREAGELLGVSTRDLRDEIEICGEYAGEGYCLETAQANGALKLLARTEAVLLDPVYTAKAMTGLIDWIKNGRLTAKNNVLFWHTGGQLTMFYATE